MGQAWANYFQLTGAASASLIGLLFIVVTLTSGLDRSRALRGQALYMTPAAMQFATVLAISALALAPGLTPPATAICVSVVVAVGFGIALRACIGIGPPGRGSQAHWSDFWTYGVLPLVLYVCLGAAAFALAMGSPRAVQALAGLMLILLLTAIRNAWDLVSWIAPRAPSLSADGLGAVAGDQAGADGVAVDQGEGQAGQN